MKANLVQSSWLGTVLVLLFASQIGEDYETSAIKAVKEVGGRVFRDEKQSGYSIVRVALNDPREFRTANWVKDSALEELGEFKRLLSLDLQGTLISDAGMKSLTALGALQSLNLSRTRLTDKGVRELSQLKSLRSIDLSRVRITDVSLEALKTLPHLQSLNLAYTFASDAGMKDLRQLASLHTLDLNQANSVGSIL